LREKFATLADFDYDFSALWSANERALELTAIDGGKAQQAFRRHIVPKLDAHLRARVEILALPSTSPANASIPRAEKLRRWSALLQWAKP